MEQLLTNNGKVYTIPIVTFRNAKFIISYS